jgi:hypothetical protein
MFGKLLKHELQATSRVMPIVYIVTVASFIVQILVSGISNNALSELSVALLIIVILAQEIVTTALVVWRFYRSMCADEAYLTHALPVKPSVLLLSKILVGWFWSVVSVLLSISGIIIILAESVPDRSASFLTRIPEGIQIFSGMIGVGDQFGPYFLVFILLQIVSAILSLETFYFAILAGTSPVFRRVGVFGVVLVGFIEYIAVQIIGALSILLIPLSVEMTIQSDRITGWHIVAERVDTSFIDAIIAMPGDTVSLPFRMGIGTWVVMPFIIALFFALTTYWIKRHTNLR